MSDTDKNPAQNANVQLGCGTLIVIAIIVMIFSGRGDLDELKKEITSLKGQLTRVEQKIDGLNAAQRGAPATIPIEPGSLER